jgi:hypothetical protein
MLCSAYHFLIIPGSLVRMKHLQCSGLAGAGGSAVDVSGTGTTDATVTIDSSVGTPTASTTADGTASGGPSPSDASVTEGSARGDASAEASIAPAP